MEALDLIQDYAYWVTESQDPEKYWHMLTQEELDLMSSAVQLQFALYNQQN